MLRSTARLFSHTTHHVTKSGPKIRPELVRWEPLSPEKEDSLRKSKQLLLTKNIKLNANPLPVQSNKELEELLDAQEKKGKGFSAY